MCKQFNGSLKGCYATELYKICPSPEITVTGKQQNGERLRI